MDDPAKLGVFSGDGRLIQAFGRRGHGPGEFTEIKDVQVGRGDTVYVLHDDRISVFLLTTFEQVRTTSSRAARMAYDLGVLSHNNLVTGRSSTLSGGPPEDLIWFHRSEAAYPVRGGLTTTDTAVTALHVRNDTIWVLRRDYKIFRKPPTGEWTLLTERPLWYAQDQIVAKREDRMAARVNDLIVDDAGRIWVLSYVFSKVPKTRPSGGEAQEGRLSTSVWQGFTQPRLDCWSPDGTLYLSAEVADGVAGLAAPNHVLHVAEEPGGNDVVSIRRLVIRR